MVKECLKAVVLAAGESKRVKTTKSKLLFDLAGRPLIFYVLDTLLSLKKLIEEIAVVLGEDKRELIKESIREEFKDKIKFCYQQGAKGTAKAVEASLEFLKGQDKVLILCADTPLITTQTLRKFIHSFLKEESDCAILTSKMRRENTLGRIVRDERGRIKEIVEKIERNDKEEEIEVNSGIYCFKVEKLAEGLKKIEINKRKKEFFLTDIIKIFYHRGYQISSFRVSDVREILGVNTQQEFSLVHRFLNERLLNTLMNKGISIIDPRTTFVGFNVKVGKDTVIYPFTYIEKDVKIGKNCRIGPFVHLREKTVIGDNVQIGNFTEINRCKLKRNVKMKHFSYLGDTVVGEGVNIGAGAVVANYDGQKKHRTFIGKGAFIGSGTVIVSPCKVGEEAMTGAGSVVTRDVRKQEIVVGVPARVLKKRIIGEREKQA